MRYISMSVVILCCALSVNAQTNKGSISGSVLDQNGAAVPGATVTVTNTGTNQSVKVTTSDNGSFTVSSLDPVTYRIVVEMTGFKKAIKENVKVDTASVASANITLETGAVAETVTISSDASLLNTESGVTSQTITERQLQGLPLNNRSVLDLAVTVPNVSGDAGTEDADVSASQPVPGFNLSVNGGRPGSTAILADGVNNTGVGIARAVVSFSPETVQEFSVQTSAYSAEYGNTGGGVINATTKSGTNQFNGIALWYHRDPVTNARPYRTGTAPRPENNLRYNQVSLTVGGPIMLPRFGEGGKSYLDGKNKSFFFFAYEPRYRTDFLTANGLLPTAAERSGDFTNLVRTNSGFLPTNIATQFNQASTGISTIFQQFNLNAAGKLVPLAQTCTVNGVTTATFCAYPGNRIPTAMIDPVALKLLQIMPAPGDYFLDNGLVRNFTLIRSVQQDEKRYTLRLDHMLSSKAKVNFRYTKTPSVGIKGAGSDINGNTGVYSDAKQFLVGFNNTITNTLLNDLHLNYTRGNFSEDFSPEFAIKTGRSYADDLGLPHLTKGGIPLFFLTQDNGYVNADLGAGGSTNNFNVEQRFNINDVVYWTKGNMSWKFGVDLNDARLNVVPFFAAAGGRWQFRTVNTSNNRGTGLTNGGNDLASFLIGVPNTVDIRPALYSYYYQWKSGAAFVQNDWRVKPNLTINLGLRYSLQYPRTEQNDLQGVFRPDLAQTVTLTDAQRRATATGLGVPTTAPIPSSVPTTILIPPFAFAGRGGRSRYITPVDYLGFEPRLGFAWSPKKKIFGLDFEKRFLVLRGGFGISHAPITGNNRSPNPDFGGFTQSSTVAAGSSGTPDTTQPVRFTGNAPLQGTSVPLDTLLGTDAQGLVYFNSLSIPGVALVDAANSGKVPYSQNWDLLVQFEPIRNTSVEFAYVGNRGRHLYLPQVNISNRDVGFVTTLESNGFDATTTFNDPLGRRSLIGAAIPIPRSSVGNTYFGFDLLNKFFDPSADSIYHGWYVNVQRRMTRGLTFTWNYTHGKSIDTASDASPDTRVLSTGQVRGQVSLGAPLSSDRSISTWDVANNMSTTFLYDLPFGHGRKFFNGAPKIVNGALGGWTVSGVYRMPGGNPFLPFITDPNKLGSANLNRVVRPDIVPGVPLKNPLWSPNCVIGSTCEPFINPAAFMRPVKGQLGNAPRSLNVRPPRQEYFDFSVNKDFPWPFASNEGKRRISFRVDLINAFNHPNFRYNNTGNTPFGLGTFPTELTTEAVGGVTQPITVAEYNTWASFNGKPQATIGGSGPGDLLLAQIRANVNAVRLPPPPGGTSGALPLDFFHVPLPQGFATTDFRAFDITSLNGYKLYRLRQTYDPNFGTLFAVVNPRYVQFGIRVYF